MLFWFKNPNSYVSIFFESPPGFIIFAESITTAQELNPEKKNILKLILLGDIACTGIISEQPEKNVERFKEIVPVLNAADFVLANLEVPLKVDDSINEYKQSIHYSLPSPTKEILKSFNIGCVSIANNHIYDCKMPGLKATINMLDELGIGHTGAGWLSEHIEPVIVNGEVKIGFLAYVDKSTNPKTEHFPELFINYFDVERVIVDIRKLSTQVDKIILSVHWGADYSFYPTPSQRAISKKLADAGADIIMGHHPHTLQPYETHNDSNIFYSLGGLTFGDYIKDGKTELQALFRKTKHSVIAKYDVSENTFVFFSTHELQGNHVKLTTRNYQRWSRGRWLLFAAKQSSAIAIKFFDFKEKVLDRIYEYFFGYYQTPLKRLTQFSNIHKIKRLLKEFKQV